MRLVTREQFQRASAGIDACGREKPLSSITAHAVQHRANELHQRRLADLVGAVHDVQTVVQTAHFEIAPNAEPIDRDLL
jgi:hypothetical protein